MKKKNNFIIKSQLNSLKHLMIHFMNETIRMMRVSKIDFVQCVNSYAVVKCVKLCAREALHFKNISVILTVRNKREF